MSCMFYKVEKRYFIMNDLLSIVRVCFLLLFAHFVGKTIITPTTAMPTSQKPFANASAQTPTTAHTHTHISRVRQLGTAKTIILTDKPLLCARLCLITTHWVLNDTHFSPPVALQVIKTDIIPNPSTPYDGHTYTQFCWQLIAPSHMTYIFAFVCGFCEREFHFTNPYTTRTMVYTSSLLFCWWGQHL